MASRLQLVACLLLQLCLLSSGMKDVRVIMDGYNFDVIIEGERWFRSGALGIRHQGMWWSNEHKDTYTMQTAEVDGKPTMGRDSIGDYDGVQ